MHGEGGPRASVEGYIEGKLFAVGIRHHLWSITVNLAASCGFAFLAWDEYGRIGFWCAAVVAVSVLRLAAHFLLLRPAAREAETSAAKLSIPKLVYRAGLVASVGLWAYVALFEMAAFDLELRYAFVIMLSALAGGAMGVFAPDLTLGRIYISLVLLPGCLGLALMGSQENVLGGVGVVFCLVMLSGLKSNHVTLARSLTFAFQNAVLLEREKLHAAAVEAANADLERRVRERTLTLEEMTRTDALTGLYNRRGALDRLKSLGAAEYALLFVDLDRFKAVNDSLGHEAGDLVLKAIARRFVAVLPEGVAVCRWGGDEFLAVAPADRALAGELAEALVRAAALPIEVEEQFAHVGASIGVAQYPDDASDVTDLIRAADLAATEAKRTGRSKWVRYDQELLIQQLRRSQIALELRQGGYERNFAVHYQPIVCAVTGEILSYEALLRMNHDRLGPVSPTEFIPIAEDTDQIYELGRWTLRQACRAATEWAAAGTRVGVAVNVSVKQILKPEWAGDVLAALDSTRLAPGMLEVEVTESVFDGEWSDLVSERLGALARAGIHVVMDDFGTGYSSLSRLKQLPIDCIKIDRAFIASADARDHAIVEAALFIARRFGFSVLAEGVETEAQAAKFAALGVERFQGYLYGGPKALPAGEAPPRRVAGRR